MVDQRRYVQAQVSFVILSNLLALVLFELSEGVFEHHASLCEVVALLDPVHMLLDLRAQGHLQVHIASHPAKAELFLMLGVELLTLALVVAKDLRQDFLFLAEGRSTGEVSVFFFSGSVHAPSPIKAIINISATLQLRLHLCKLR